MDYLAEVFRAAAFLTAVFFAVLEPADEADLVVVFFAVFAAVFLETSFLAAAFFVTAFTGDFFFAAGADGAFFGALVRPAAILSFNSALRSATLSVVADLRRRSRP